MLRLGTIGDCIQAYAMRPGIAAAFLLIIAMTIFTRKPCYRTGDRAMRPIYGCPVKFQEALATPTATLPEIVNGLCYNRAYSI